VQANLERELLNVEIQRNAELLRSVLDATPDWIFLKDTNFRFMLVNQSFAADQKMKAEEMIGKDDIDLGIPEELVFGNLEKGIRGFRADDMEVLSGKPVHISRDVAADAKGNIIIFDTQKLPLRDAQGNVYAILGFARNITDRTRFEEDIRKRAAELEAVAHVSTVAATTADVDELLQTVVDLTKESFKLYHAHIYLIEGNQLVLAAGAGEAGRMMKARYHSIPLNREHSLVARAARTRQGVISNDVTQELDFLPNPLLPDTQSELAIPLIAGNELIGVLDVQADSFDRFTEEDVRIKTILAEQVAITIQNVRTFKQVLQARNELETVTRVSAATTTILNLDTLLQTVSDLTKENFNLYHAQIYLLEEDSLFLAAGAGDPGRRMREAGFFIPLNHVNSLVARAARSLEGVIANDVANAPEFLPNPLLPDTQSEMAIPMIIGDQVVGVLDVQASVINRFTDADLRILSALADQVSVAAQNARRFTETQKRLQETQGMALITEYIRQGDPFEEFLENILNVVFEIMDADTVVFSRFDHEQQMWRGVTGVGEGITTELVRTFVDPAPLYPHGLEAVETQQIVAVDDTSAYPDFPVEYIEKLGLQSVLVLPIISGNLVVGVVFLNYTREPRRFKPEDTALARSIADQISLALERRTSEEELTRVRYAVEGSSDAVVITDLEGHVRYTNRAFTQMFAVTPEEAANFTPQDYFTTPETVEEIGPALQQGGAWTGEVTIAAKDGNSIPVYGRINPIADASGIILGYVASYTDISERKRAEEEIRKRATELEAVAQVSTAVTTNLDVEELLQTVADLTKERFNLYHAHIYRYNAEQEEMVLAAGAGEPGMLMKMSGHYIPVGLQHSIVARTARTREGVIVNDVTTAETYLPNPLLPDTKSEMALPMVVGDELFGVLDVQSEQFDRFTQEDLRVFAILADQVAVALKNALAYSVEREAAERLREVDRLKSQFLANMSHELRTPLNSIIGYSEVLLDGVDGELPEEAIEDVEAVHDSGKHLLAIINEILDMAKIDAGQLMLDLKPTDVPSVVSEVVKVGQALIKEKPITLEVVEETKVPRITADSLRLRQILLNLVGNAVKFTEKGSVTILYGQQDAENVYIKVRDTGIGISPENLALVFQRFQQVDGSSTRRAGGTGLGLSITRQLIQMHGGEIYVESELGVGSTFWFTIPVHLTFEPDEDPVTTTNGKSGQLN
jgi:PAS domain S-box-containing protein